MYVNIFAIVFLDNDTMSDLKEGTYIIRYCNRLTPLDPGMDEGIGGLVGLTIQRSGKKIKTVVEDEELCSAKSCQIPRCSAINWVKCDSLKCQKWFHVQCAGLSDDVALPRKWFCGCTKFKKENIFE